MKEADAKLSSIQIELMLAMKAYERPSTDVLMLALNIGQTVGSSRMLKLLKRRMEGRVVFDELKETICTFSPEFSICFLCYLWITICSRPGNCVRSCARGHKLNVYVFMSPNEGSWRMWIYPGKREDGVGRRSPAFFV